MTLVICIAAALYFAIAIAVFRFVSRRIQEGFWRPVARGTVVALFFSVGFVGGNGHGPDFPMPMWLFVLADTFHPPQYRDYNNTVAPLLFAGVQWLALVGLFSIGYFVHGAFLDWRARSNDD